MTIMNYRLYNVNSKAVKNANLSVKGKVELVLQLIKPKEVRHVESLFISLEIMFMGSKTIKDNNIQLMIPNAILIDCKIKIMTVNIRKNINLESILVKK